MCSSMGSRLLWFLRLASCCCGGGFWHFGILAFLLQYKDRRDFLISPKISDQVEPLQLLLTL